MKVIGCSSKNEAVLEWLKAEMDSARFSDDLRSAIKELNCSNEIVTAPHLDNIRENKTRWKILKTYRMWLDRNFDDYGWSRVELDKNDTANLNYIDYSYWNELSDNIHKVGRAVDNLNENKVVFDVPNDRFYLVAKNFDDGLDFAPIIIVSRRGDNQGEILEGHLRATGYLLSQSQKPLKAIWGELR